MGLKATSPANGSYAEAMELVSKTEDGGCEVVVVIVGSRREISGRWWLKKGNPMKFFEVERGLRPRDPLSSFLFVIVTKGLSCLIKKAVAMGDFKGFRVD
ncbi:hypothetical protein KIW84_057175 [Lathyrus oleraceus]|uniref:Uncharacterized protein n=1 Tax=Pisum sativum TaxID=3888 RepID=A0A9D5AM58_PEA|nr:hypothetical protein KIW84_057175 [Pisum sativum]